MVKVQQAMVTHPCALLTAQTSCDRTADNTNQHNLHLIYWNDLFIKNELPPQTPPQDAVITVSEGGRVQVCTSRYFLGDSEIQGKIERLITELGTLKPRLFTLFVCNKA